MTEPAETNRNPSDFQIFDVSGHFVFKNLKKVQRQNRRLTRVLDEP